MFKSANQKTRYEFGRSVGRPPLTFLPETMKRLGKSLLEQYLQEAHPDLTIEVINAGVPGEVYWGSKTDFENYHSQLESEFVLLYHGPNDLRQVSTTPMHRHGAHKTHQIGPANPGFHSLLSNQEWALMRVLRRTVQPLQPLQPHWADKSITQNMINDLQNRAQQMIQSAQHRRAQPHSSDPCPSSTTRRYWGCRSYSSR